MAENGLSFKKFFVALQTKIGSGSYAVNLI